MTRRSKVDWTPAVLADLLAKREAGVTAIELATHFGVCVTTIYVAMVRARSLRAAGAQAATIGSKT